VYYWSHALIARDWYRYAELDPGLDFDTNKIVKDFIIYCRAWSGTREYRLKFLELLIDSQLNITSQVNFAETDSVHYTCHQYVNSEFECKHNTLEQHFTTNTADSNSSARYSVEDYNCSAIDVVLETLFDDGRIQLTEKVLRPIACGKPFILVSTPGSLAYLRSYGFKTFSPLVDESYDTIQDPTLRLQAVISSMKKISSLSEHEKKCLWTKLDEISQFNREHFFSKQFINTVINEYQQNVNQAIEQLNPISGVYFQQWYKTRIDKNDLSNFDHETIKIIHAVDQLRTIDPSQAASGGDVL
jgi:hypothetical protein